MTKPRSPAKTTDSADARPAWPWVFSLMVLAVIAFHNALPTEFVLDGVNLVRDNPRLHETTAWADLWQSNYWGGFSNAGLWRPLTMAVWRMEYGTLGFGDDPRGYVVVNLLLHLGVILMLWLTARRLGLGQWASFTAAAWFAVHPVVTEIVPNIVGGADLLVALALLLGFWAYRRYVQSGRPGWLLLLGGIWLAGLWSKENAVILPVLLLAADLVLNVADWRAAPRRMLQRRALPFMVLAVVGATWLGWRWTVLHALGEPFTAAVNNPLVLETAGVRMLTAVKLMGLYLGQAFWPVSLCADYSFRTVDLVKAPADTSLLAAAAGLLTVAVLAGWAQRRRPVVTLGLIFFGVAIFPLSNFFVPVGIIRADRFLYIPLLGLMLAVAAGGEWCLERLPRRAAVVRWLVLALPLLGMLWLTIGRNPDWHNARRLWRHTVMAAPDNVKARHNLALQRLPAPGDPAPAEDLLVVARHLEHAVRVSRELPGDEFFEPWVNLGNVYLRLAALEMPDSRMNAAGTQRLEQAVAILEEGVARSQHRGRRYASWQSALTARAEQLGELRPEFGDAKLHLALASALDALGRPVEAGRQLRRAMAVEPANPSPYLRLALLYARAGQRKDVEILVGIAVRLPIASAEDRLLLNRLMTLLQQWPSMPGAPGSTNPGE
ncbi:MAG: glycosyltransferase family 39 protein [Acidobacteria bacterium]|nr:glycosyltransferase family 39 protein [Acidobacteriota bacterium]